MNMRSLLLLPALVSAKTLWTDLEAGTYSYEQWVGEFNSFHLGSREVFEANLAEIRAHNADPTQTWKMGVNQFTGMTKSEFKNYIRGYTKGEETSSFGALEPADLSSHVSLESLPNSFDWRSVTPPVLTPVKNQGQCGSCWIFSATCAIESQVMIKTGSLYNLSEQESLDCVPVNPQNCGGTGGCNGGTQIRVFDWIQNTGLATMESYPYLASNSPNGCQASSHTPVVNVTGGVTLPGNNLTALLNAVVSVGPISISADAENWASYESGIYNNKNCGSDIDHAIVLVGYQLPQGNSPGYYIVRNSWGNWGENGYIRIALNTNDDNNCAMDSTPQDGFGCAGDTAPIKVCGLCGILSNSSYPTGVSLI